MPCGGDGSPSYESVTTYEYEDGLLVREVETKTFARHSSEGHSPSSVATRVYSYGWVYAPAR